MCKLAAFFEGGISYERLERMPIDEFFAVIDCAKEISNKRREEMKRGK